MVTPAGLEKFFTEAFEPAGDVLSAPPTITEAMISRLVAAGTSAAAPHVSGVAALIDGKAGGGLGGGQLKTQIQQTADDLGKPGADLLYSHGRVNAFRAVTE